jgi:hypothetical protein
MVRLCSAAVVSCLLAGSASAITLVPMTFEQLVDASAAVVYGRVASVHGQWTADRRGIDSIASIDAIEYLKGNLSERVSVRLPGGRVGGMVNLIPGAPVLAEGELIVLFLTTRGPALPMPTGLTQGVFRVTIDAATRTPVVRSPAPHTAGEGRIVRGAAAGQPVALAEFGARVRGAARGAR